MLFKVPCEALTEVDVNVEYVSVKLADAKAVLLELSEAK